MARKNSRTSFDIKSNSLALVAFMLKSADISVVTTELKEQFGENSTYFENEPVIIDLSSLAEDDVNIDFAALIQTLQQFQMKPFAINHGSIAQMEAAQKAGLLVAPESQAAVTPSHDPISSTPPKTSSITSQQTLVVDRPLRSGQQIYARDADLIMTSMVSNGAEIIADGHIHVYAPLRGRVIAGAQGNTQARIFTTCFEPELFSIAGVFQTTEKDLPKDIVGKSVMVHLEENSLILTPIKISG